VYLIMSEEAFTAGLVELRFIEERYLGFSLDEFELLGLRVEEKFFSFGAENLLLELEGGHAVLDLVVLFLH